MSFYSELTRNGITTNRRVRRKIKGREAVERNMLTPEHKRKDYRRRVFAALDAGKTVAGIVVVTKP